MYKTRKTVIPIFSMIFALALSMQVYSQDRSDNNRQRENHQKATRPVTTHPPTRQVNPRPTVNRQPVTRPTVNRQPVTRPTVNRQPATRPTVNRAPNYSSSVRRPTNRPGYRPQGWAPTRRAYTRPPVVYNGRRFYTYRKYYAHPFTAFYYGPRWHPIGFFLASMVSAAIIIDVANRPYHYADGVFYAPYNNGYQVVPAPPGAYVPSLPEGFQQLSVGGQDYYYFGGAFYILNGNQYEVVQAPAGGVVYNLPQGASQVQIDNYDYVVYNDTYYQPIQINGQDAYEVVEMEQQQ